MYFMFFISVHFIMHSAMDWEGDWVGDVGFQKVEMLPVYLS